MDRVPRCVASILVHRSAGVAFAKSRALLSRNGLVGPGLS
jgi:hypothetical protein